MQINGGGDKPSMGGMLAYLKGKKGDGVPVADGGGALADLSDSGGAATDDTGPEVPGGDDEGVLGEPPHVCEACGHTNAKKVDAQMNARASSNFDDRE